MTQVQTTQHDPLSDRKGDIVIPSHREGYAQLSRYRVLKDNTSTMCDFILYMKTEMVTELQIEITGVLPMLAVLGSTMVPLTFFIATTYAQDIPYTEEYMAQHDGGDRAEYLQEMAWFGFTYRQLMMPIIRLLAKTRQITSNMN